MAKLKNTITNAAKNVKKKKDEDIAPVKAFSFSNAANKVKSDDRIKEAVNRSREVREREQRAKEIEAELLTRPEYAQTRHDMKELDLLAKQILLSSEYDVQETTERVVAPVKNIWEGMKNTEWFSNAELFDDGYQPWKLEGLRTASATMADLVEHLQQGGIDFAEGAIDAGATTLGDLAGMVGWTDAQDFLMNDVVFHDVVKKPWEYVEDNLGIDIPSVHEILGLSDEDIENRSILGEGLEGSAESLAQMLLTQELGEMAKAAGVKLPWQVTTGVTTYGQGVSEGMEQGLDNEQAKKLGFINAVAEIATESLFGDSLMGEKGAFDLGKLTSEITNPLLKLAADYGLTIPSNAIEEGLTEAMNIAGEAYVRGEDVRAALSSEESLKRIGNSMFSGAMFSAITNAPKAVKAGVTGTDFKTGLTKNETEIVDRVTEKLVNEKESNGEKISDTKRGKIRESVIEMMDRGEISTDLIEEVFGGETYEKYYNLTKREEAIVNKLAQQYSGAELKQKVDSILSGSERSAMKDQLSNEVSKFVQNDRLSESYRQNAEGKVKFNADLSQYNDAERKIVQKAIESEVLNNKRKTHELVDFVAKVAAKLGVDFDFVNNDKLKELGFSVDGADINGYVDKNGNIVLNAESSKYLNVVLGHEISHVLEGTELYEAVEKILVDFAVNKKAKSSKFKNEYQERLDRAISLYQNIEGYKGTEGFKNIEREVFADLIGDYLFTDKSFVEHLANTSHKGFQKILDSIEGLYKMATAGSKEAKALEKLKQTFMDAFAEAETKKNTTKDGFVRYGLNGNPDFNSEEWSIVNRRKYSEFYNPKYDIDNNRKWMYASEKGYTVFAVYSKSDPDDPTILYGSSGKAATRDYNDLNDFISGGGINGNRNRTTANRLLAYIESKQGGGSARISADQGGIQEAGDVPISIEESGSNGGRDSENGKAAFRGEGLTEYGDEASDNSGASFITFSNDYAAIRNFMKEGDVGESSEGTKFSLSEANSTDINDYSLKAIEDMTFEELEQEVLRLGLDDILLELDDDILLDDDFTIDDISEETSVKPEIIEILYRRSGLGKTHIADGKKAVMTESRINQRIQEHSAKFSPDYARAYITRISPTDFVDLTVTEKNMDRENFDANVRGDFDGRMGDWDYEQQLRDIKDPPRLSIDITTGKIFSHNGRHRVRALEMAGIESVEIEVEFYDEDGLVKYNAHVIPDMAISSQFDSAVETHISNIIPFNHAFKPEIEKYYGENANGDAKVKYSLSNGSENTYGDYHISGEDVSFKDIAPAKTTQETVKTKQNLPIYDNQKVITDEEEFDSLDQRRAELETQMLEDMNPSEGDPDLDAFYKHNTEYEDVKQKMLDLADKIAIENEGKYNYDDADAPPVRELYPGEVSAPIAYEDPFTGRNYDEVGRNRKANAFMTDNPEFKPFFQMEAAKMLEDYADSTKAELLYNEDVHYETQGEHGFYGNKRHTSKDIAKMLDEWRMTWDDIYEGLEAIADDSDMVNRAAAKHVEFMLHQRLTNGYVDFHTNRKIPPNQAYIDMISQRQKDARANAFAEESFNSLMDEVGYAADDIAPVAQTPTTPAPDSAEQTKRAKILFGEDKSTKKKNKVWSWIKEHVFRHGAVFEDLALKTGNRELQARFDNIRRAESRAQNFIGNGIKGMRSLLDIRKAVMKAGKLQPFNYYLYHLHNIDRMTLADRFKDTPNKEVFGDVSAEDSRKSAAYLEAQNPEFKQWAQDIYAINNYLRNMLVENGIISQETADLWQQMYPHYVPIGRINQTGLNVNVPLDSKKTGVNAPIKRATGGNSDMYDLFDVMASRVEQTYKAIAKNRFGTELMNTLGTAIEADTETQDMDALLDSIDKHEDLLQQGKDGQSPTFTVFENGERVKFAITDEMYDAMKPSQFTGTLPILNWLNNVRRDVLTTYNPAFMITNPIKDTGDIIVNSQHPIRTYLAIPKAIKEMAKKGKYYQERMEAGAGDDSYFDTWSKTYAKEKSLLSKIVGWPFEKVRQANEFIEQVPRMAEYIASREMGRSVDVSMLDAARVTTNFGAPGDLTNMINRNGGTFLSASVEGFNQQVRNIREAKAEGLKGWAKLAGKYALAGLPALLLNNALWDDDEEYEELADYVKQNYYIVAKFGDGRFVRIPKGRAVAVIQDAFVQIDNMMKGDEVDWEGFGELVVNNIAPNNVFDNWLGAPLVQAFTNKAWYGGDLVPSSLQDLPTDEQYDESTDSISKWLAENFDPFGLGAYKINYILDQYSGGFGDMVLPYLTPEADGGGLGAAFVDKFTTDSVFNNQNVTDFYDLADELKVNANSYKATDDDILKNKYINAVKSDLSDLYAEKREIQNKDKSDAWKQKKLREVQEEINNIVRDALESYEDITYEGNYAEIGGKYYKWDDKDETWEKLSAEQTTKYLLTKDAKGHYVTDGKVHYRLDEDGNWTKISDKQLARQKEVTKSLGITPDEYWSKTSISYMPMSNGEYEYAFENPNTYTVAKAVGGYEAYSTYSKGLSGIKADKDSNGKSISGSRKKKVVSYISSLDIDDGEKYILYKKEYPSDDSYNREIVEYLNSRDDISYREMEIILTELGFKVSADGRITW